MPTHRTILVVDDSPDDIFLLKEALTKAGITSPLKAVHNGEEAINYLSGHGQFADRTIHPFPRILLLDLKMPRKNGFDVLRWIGNRPGLRRMVVTVLTSSDESSDVNLAYDLGANSYLRKPQSFAEFTKLAEKVYGYWIELNIPPECASSTVSN